MDVDPVRAAAQATVDAIDRQMTELSAARESLVRLFGLGVRVAAPEQAASAPQTAITQPQAPLPKPTPAKPPPTPVNANRGQNEGYTPVNYCINGNSNIPRDRESEQRWGSLRQRVLRYLKDHGPTDRREIREKLGISGRTNFKVMSHDWFQLTGRTYSLTPEGEEAATTTGVIDE